MIQASSERLPVCPASLLREAIRTIKEVLLLDSPAAYVGVLAEHGVERGGPALGSPEEKHIWVVERVRGRDCDHSDRQGETEGGGDAHSSLIRKGSHPLLK